MSADVIMGGGCGGGGKQLEGANIRAISFLFFLLILLAATQVRTAEMVLSGKVLMCVWLCGGVCRTLLWMVNLPFLSLSMQLV